MTVTNTRVHRFNMVKNIGFLVKCCFSLPERKTGDLKEGKTTFDFNPFPNGFLSKRALKCEDRFNFYSCYRKPEVVKSVQEEENVTLPKYVPLFDVQATSELFQDNDSSQTNAPDEKDSTSEVQEDVPKKSYAPLVAKRNVASSSMMDDEGPQSLFVVVSWDYDSPYFSSILQLDHEYVSSPTTQPQNTETEFTVNFCRPQPLPKVPVPYIWTYSPLASSTDEADLYMVPDWCYREFEDDAPLDGCVFNLRTKKCKRMKHPLAPKHCGHVVSLGGHIYFMAHPDTHSTAPGPLFERYNPLEDSWEKLKPFPKGAIEDCCELGLGRGIEATAVWDDTIVLNMCGAEIWAYNATINKWYPVHIDDGRCYDIIGETVVLGNTIYALTEEDSDELSADACNLVLALSIERGKVNGDFVYKCSLLSEILVPGMGSFQFRHKNPRHFFRHLVNLGQDNLCLVQSCNLIGVDVCQHIQVTNIKLNGDKSMTVTNTRVHRFNMVKNIGFHVKCCFSLPERKAGDLKEGKTTFEFNPFPNGFLSKRAIKCEDRFNFYSCYRKPEVVKPVQEEENVTLPKYGPLFDVQATSELFQDNDSSQTNAPDEEDSTPEVQEDVQMKSYAPLVAKSNVASRERGGYQQPPGRGGYQRGGRQQTPGRGEGDQQFSSRGGRGQQPGQGGRYVTGYNARPPQQPVQNRPLSVATAPFPMSEATRAFEKLNLGAASGSTVASSSSVPQAASSAITDTRLTALPPVSSKTVKFIPRLNYGTSGKACVIKANHFRVSFAVKDIHHYDVKISPEVLSKTVSREILNALKTRYQSHLGLKRFAYDGRKSLYTAGPLPFESQDFDVVLGDSEGSKRERKFLVKITYAAQTDLHQLQEFLNRKQRDAPQETIQALDVVFREALSDAYVTVGRSFFHPSLGNVGLLGEGLHYWYGYYQSLRPTQMGLSLNIDISARPFYEPILVTDFIVKCLNLRGGLGRSLSEQDRLKVKKALKGLRVEIAHPDSVRRYKITGLSTVPLNKLTFSIDGSGDKSVANYFREKYNIVLQYGHLPALQSGNDARPAYLPMEVCKIVEGQRYAKKLNEKQVSVMLKATCQRPNIRENNIKEMVKGNNYNKDPLVSEDFGMEVTGDLTSINARVLKPPMLKYHHSGRESSVFPRFGQWNMINKKMINGGRIGVWACVNFSNYTEDAVYGFCAALVNMCCEKGMVINPKPVLPILSDQARNAEKLLGHVHSECIKLKKQLQLLIVILPEASGLYGTIKRVCETELGIVSQCCQPKHLAKFNKQYLENVALKINVKVGGTNLHLDEKAPRKDYLRDMPTIVFGADVTHPQPGDGFSSSIAAVVASMDWPDVTKYRCLVSAQSPRQEIIQDLYTCSDESKNVVMHGGMIREHLRAYYNSTGRKPSRIIFYRDGVSEGQFSQVLLHEVDSIRKACQSLQEGYLPPITFVVVQKRHHTRLFVGNHGERDATDKSGNILPGTVVDTEICHPTEFDFYLCSHAGIQGTSRPTHYHVLFDENNFSADDLQALTNNLCYTYARCTRSVSMVPAAYYAHLAAFRARYYAEDRSSDVDSTLDGRRGGGQTVEQGVVEVRRLPDIKDNVKEVMFYC